MRTTHFLPDVSTRGAQVNKIEKVSSLGHQMSLEGGLCTVRFHVWRWVCVQWGLVSEQAGASEGGFLYSEVQCIMVNGHMGPPPLPFEETDTTENITFLMWWKSTIFMLCESLSFCDTNIKLSELI